MSSFDFEAGKRFREEGDLAEALRCLMSAVEQDRDSIEAYVELARTYVLAFGDSGDPLCLDSARKVCIAALRRDPAEDERRAIFRMQDEIEELLMESQKAEVDAMTDALNDSGFERSLNGPPLPTDGLLDDIDLPLDEHRKIDRDH